MPAADAADEAARGAAVIACPPEVAAGLIASVGDAPCPLPDMYKYTLFTLKNELL